MKVMAIIGIVLFSISIIADIYVLLQDERADLIGDIFWLAFMIVLCCVL